MLFDAISSINKGNKLDHYGMCALSLRCVLLAAPVQTIEFFNDFVSRRSSFTSVVVNGHTCAKKKGHILASQTRIILPLPVILAAIDAIIAKYFTAIADKTAENVSANFFECARKKRQILDLVFPLLQVIEKGVDCHGKACVAQSDIRQFYDHLQPLIVHRWVLKQNMPSWVSFAFLRLHTLVPLNIRVGDSHAMIERRTISVLMGTRSAAAAGRIPIIDVASKRAHIWSELAFSTPKRSFALGTFVDNLFSTGTTAEDAITILEDAAVHLKQIWKLHIGDGLKEFVLAAGSLSGQHFPSGWRRGEELRCLGHIISS